MLRHKEWHRGGAGAGVVDWGVVGFADGRFSGTFAFGGGGSGGAGHLARNLALFGGVDEAGEVSGQFAAADPGPVLVAGEIPDVVEAVLDFPAAPVQREDFGPAVEGDEGAGPLPDPPVGLVDGARRPGG